MKDSLKNTGKVFGKEHKPDIATKAKAVMPEKGIKVAKKNTAAGGATGTTGHRAHVKATSGAKYAITAKLSGGTSPEAGATQANGRIIAPAVNRTRPNFTDGAHESLA